jgi:hypothetical protein
MDLKPNQTVIAFKAPAEVVARIDAVAAAEGATRAGIARRFVIYGLAKGVETAAVPAA